MRHYQHDGVSYASDSLPPFFTILDSVLEHQRMWIVENKSGSFETHSMLALVGAVLGFVSVK